MTHSDIALKAAAEQASIGIKEHTVPLQYITHDYSPAAGTQYAGVNVPTISLSAGDFDADSNNFCDA